MKNEEQIIKLFKKNYNSNLLKLPFVNEVIRHEVSKNFDYEPSDIEIVQIKVKLEGKLRKPRV